MAEQMTTAAAAIDLKKFCDPDESYGSLDMSEPWIKDGWEYATDARICIRIPAAGKSDTVPGDDRKFADAYGIFKFDTADCVLEWPTEPYLKAKLPCPQCGGDGEIVCDNCDEVVATCHYPGCGGQGDFEQEVYRRVGNHLIGVKYDRMIIALPNVRWSDKTAASKPLFFVFDGGQGMIMGMRRHELEV